MNKQILFPILVLCLLGGNIYLTMALISSPAPLPVDASPTDFSAGRAMQDLEVISREPHPSGSSQAHADVLDYLLSEIRTLGLEPQVQRTIGTRVMQPGYMISGSVENILVRLPGTDRDGAILLLAHYDSSPESPGALDNGTGTVMLLEILRALQAGPPLRQDVIFFFTDGEERGSLGVYAFISEHPWFDEVELVINLETFVNGPPTILAISPENGAWVEALASGLPRPAFVSIPYHLFGKSSTDAAPFLETGIPAVDIEAPSFTTDYHSNLDKVGVVKPGVQQHAGAQVLALVRTLGNRPDLEMRAPDENYFPVLGMLVHYPNTWAFPFAIAGGICFLATLFYGFRKKALTWSGLGSGFLAVLLCLVFSVGISTLLWKGIQTLHPEYGYTWNRVHVSDDILYALGFFILAFAVATASIALARKKVTALNLAAGALVIWVPLALIGAILVPAISFLCTWVLLSGSLALLLALTIRSKKNALIWQVLGFLASAILATFLWVPMIYIALVSSGFLRPWIMFAEAALWLAAMLPALDWINSLKRWLLPASASLIALAFLLTGHFLVGKETPPPMVNPIGYWLDANDGEAYWVAWSDFFKVPDARQSDLMADPVSKPYTELFPAAPQYSITTSEAPLLELNGPRLEVHKNEWVVDRRAVTIRFTTSMHDRLYIFIPNASLLAITFPNNVRAELGGSSEWKLRFDGMPVEGMEIRFEFSTSGPIQFLLLEEKTGLPSFPGLVTQPEPGTMRNPGGYDNAQDFTAIYRAFEIPPSSSE